MNGRKEQIKWRTAVIGKYGSLFFFINYTLDDYILYWGEDEEFYSSRYLNRM